MVKSLALPYTWSIAYYRISSMIVAEVLFLLTLFLPDEMEMMKTVPYTAGGGGEEETQAFTKTVPYTAPEEDYGMEVQDVFVLCGFAMVLLLSWYCWLLQLDLICCPLALMFSCL